MKRAEVPSSPLFDRAATGYDAARRALIPCFDAFYGTALDLISMWHAGGAMRVLDLGAGTGLLSAMVLDRFPDARLRLVDASEAMLDQAHRRFAEREDIEFAVDDIGTANLGGPWDLVVSALAVHHLADAAKRTLFASVRGALAAGGLFVNAEQVLGPTPAVEAAYASRWLDDVRVAGVQEEEVRRAVERMVHDRCTTVEDQLTWMRDAGLVDVDCSFKAWRFAVLSGRRPA